MFALQWRFQLANDSEAATLLVGLQSIGEVLNPHDISEESQSAFEIVSSSSTTALVLVSISESLNLIGNLAMSPEL
jgi:hypothetical protein